jgi:hypothetical protein
MVKRGIAPAEILILFFAFKSWRRYYRADFNQVLPGLAATFNLKLAKMEMN